MPIAKARKIKITVIKKLDTRELFDGHDMGAVDGMAPVCGMFQVGDEFVIDGATGIPEGFCQGAFMDISRFVSGLRFGADYPWMKEPGTVICSCFDGLRPVIFKLERMDQEIS